jgi:hypothetical protein
MMPLSFCDDSLHKELIARAPQERNVDLLWDGSPAGGKIVAFDFTERRQVPNGSSQIRLQWLTVCGEGAR